MALDALSRLLGDRLQRGEAVREAHGHDEAHIAPAAPDAVAFPESTQEVAEIVRLCAAQGVPVIPFGAGTSLEGQIIPTQGGVSLDMSRMNKVLEIHADDLDVVVQPGVTRKQLDAELRATGLFFPVDPGADATIGGMAATRASGTTTVRYGAMRENVLALEAVGADGRIFRTGSRARKSASGYDLTRLLVGSEGTLAVFTELTLRLYGRPEAEASARCGFPDVQSAVDAVILTIQSGLPVARIELLDAVTIRAVNAHSGLSMDETPHLFLEFHGAPAGVEEQAERFGEIAAEFGATGYARATRPEQRSALWTARHNAYYASKALRPGCSGWVTDACVPISRLADCIAETEADIAESGLVAPIVGHVGDGNFHLCILLDPDSTEDHDRAAALSARIAARAVAMGGVVSGEHGVGLGKKGYLAAEHGEAALDVMRAVKRALDPHGVLNPGKMLP